MQKIPTFEDAVRFHGHACPGLVMGFRVAQAAVKRLSGGRAADEEFVAIVQNDSCAVDAVQLVCGCTFGKGNLIFHDHGKHAYTFFNRQTGDSLRIYAKAVHLDDPDDPRLVELFKKENKNAAEQAEQRAILDRRIEWLLKLSDEDFLCFSEATLPLPSRARIFESIRCDGCGERVMATRIQPRGEDRLCLECCAG